MPTKIYNLELYFLGSHACACAYMCICVVKCKNIHWNDTYGNFGIVCSVWEERGRKKKRQNAMKMELQSLKVLPPFFTSSIPCFIPSPSIPSSLSPFLPFSSPYPFPPFPFLFLSFCHFLWRKMKQKGQHTNIFFTF